MAEALCDQLFSDVDGDLMRQHTSDTDDLFVILEAWEDCVTGGGGANTPRGTADVVLHQTAPDAAATPKPAAAKRRQQGCREEDDGTAAVPAPKRQRCSPVSSDAAAGSEDGAANKTSHITVERNRRKQMNEHLAVLRSLMPCFYVKRGDQASIIGGVVDYIKELQQVLQSLEAKKQRKAYTEQVLSPRPPACCSPRPPLSPRSPLLPLKSTPPISRRPAVPISPRTPPTPSSPYKPCRQPMSAAVPLPPPAGSSAYASPAMTPTREPAAASYLPSLDTIAADLCAYAANNNKQLQACGGVVLPDVKVEFSGANLVVKTVSHRAPGQTVKVIAALEGRSLEILDAKINTVNDTVVNSYTIKIGIECELSAEELVQVIQEAFSS